MYILSMREISVGLTGLVLSKIDLISWKAMEEIWRDLCIKIKFPLLQLEDMALVPELLC
jgi:hypothetical protein